MMSSEKSSKPESKICTRRLLFAVIVLLAGVVVILTAGVIVMEEEIRTLRKNVAEYQTWKDEDGDKRSASGRLAESSSSHEEFSKRKRVRLSRSKQSRCESIRIPMCRNMPYSSAQFPNLLNHQSQDDAIALANVLGPLVKSGCSSSIEHFLCSVLAPPCGGTQQPMPPCKGLCKRATRSCRDLLNKFQITLDPSMRCKNLPKEGTSKCFNGSWPRGTNTPSPAFTHTTTNCRPVTHQCNRFLPHNWQAQFPNYFGHKDETEASANYKKLEGLLRVFDKDCSAILSTFLCPLYVPPCRNTKHPSLPCREFCLKAKSQCKREIRLSKRAGLRWHSFLKCKNFPGKDEGSCYNGQKIPEPTTQLRPTVPGKCEVLTVPLCKNIPYNMTEFPNFFRHQTQAAASLEVQQFSPLVQVNCSPDLAFFLCSLYSPICTSLDRPPLPCRELCVRVRQGCLPVLLQYNFKWPEVMKCEQFPRSGDSICIDRPNVVAFTTPSPSPTIQLQVRSCEPLRASTCSAFHYSMTTIPNFFNHHTQNQASLEMSKFDAVIKTNCSKELNFFLCSLYAPPCDPHPYAAPCKELCSRVRKQCISTVRQLRIKWPIPCSKFKRKSEVPGCLDAPSSPKATALTPRNTLGNGSCEALTIPLCQDLHYNMTLLPNFLNHRTQEEAALEVHQFYPLVTIDCSPDMSLFLCSLYAPSCTAPFKPCRDLCTSVRDGCFPIMKRFGFAWPQNMACDNFPVAGQGTKCIVSPSSLSTTAPPTTRPSKR